MSKGKHHPKLISIRGDNIPKNIYSHLENAILIEFVKPNQIYFCMPEIFKTNV